MNKITEEHINELVENAEVVYTTAFGKSLIATFKFESGWVETVDASCVDPANFDIEVGKKIVMERIKNKMWELEGYALQKLLAEVE
jgi:Phage protein (N4 Gp49/phage Sf6 gene 66) family